MNSSTSCTNQSTIVVDDSDTAQITYTGDWLVSGGPSEFNGTAHGTDEQGASAAFTFNGTGVSVFGTIPALPSGADPALSYTLDGLPVLTPPTANATTNANASATSTSLFGQLVFRSPALAAGPHTLVVTATGDAPTLWIDYVTYTTCAPPPPATSTTAAPSSTTTTTTVTATETITATATPTPTPPHTALARSKLPAAAIVGCTLGPLVLLASALMLLLCWRRARRHRARSGDAEDAPARVDSVSPDMAYAVIAPFPPPPPPPLAESGELPSPHPPSPGSEPSGSRPQSLPGYPASPRSASYTAKKIYDDPAYGYQPYDPANPNPNPNPNPGAPMTYDPFSKTPIHLGFPALPQQGGKGPLMVVNQTEGEGGDGPPLYKR